MPKYLVSNDCIGCDMCANVAPDNFLINKVEGKASVYKQPETVEQVSLCNEAIESCPVEAISKKIEAPKINNDKEKGENV